MYAGINEEQLAEDTWKLMRGHSKMFGFSLAWDFTDGLTKEQFKERWLRQMNLWQPKQYITKSGRILIPELNIY